MAVTMTPATKPPAHGTALIGWVSREGHVVTGGEGGGGEQSHGGAEAHDS